MKKGVRAFGLRIMAVSLAVLAFAFAAGVSVLAASERVEEIVQRVQTLINANVDYEWLPDISANQSGVQAILDLYLECTPQERAEFTQQQKDDLRGYFAALYEVKGLDRAEADSLFSTAEPTPAPPTPPPSPDSALPEPEASSQPGNVVQPEQTSSLAQPPVISNPPQAPENEGWLSVFGSGGIGTVLFVILLGLAIVLALRFLVLLARAPRPARMETEEDRRAKELFGESYDPAAPPGGYTRMEQLPAKSNTKAPVVADVGTAPSGENGAPDLAALTIKSAREESTGAARQTHSLPGPDYAVAPPVKIIPQPQRAAPQPIELPEEQLTPPNPDAPNAIGLRSFSGKMRTGRPSRMSFRQGAPEDIDAIDE